MSYQDELQRLVEAKASMRQSIINKGVDVPQNAKIEDFAEYIKQIKASEAEDDGTEWGTLYTTDYPDGLVLEDEASYQALATSRTDDRSAIMVNGISLAARTVKGYTFGKNCTTIGVSFLRMCTGFDQNLIIPSYVTNIDGIGFMFKCDSFTGILTVNTSVAITNYNALSTTNAGSAMYTEGVRINGPGGAAWVAGMKNTSSSPYRKLILVEE